MIPLPIIFHKVSHRPVDVELTVSLALKYALVLEPVPQHALPACADRPREGEVDQGHLDARLGGLEADLQRPC